MNRPAILLRSSWQTVNIGDIAHTPGLLEVLSREMNEARVIFWPGAVRHWPGRLDRGVGPMLRHGYPALSILDPQDEQTLDAAIDESDLLLHGSGASLAGLDAIERWRGRCDKPYGTFGVTLDAVTEPANYALERAAFVLTRETASVAVLASVGISGPHVGCVPDATLAFSLGDEATADELITEYGLEDGRFLCIVPRLRGDRGIGFLPYWPPPTRPCGA